MSKLKTLIYMTIFSALVRGYHAYGIQSDLVVNGSQAQVNTAQILNAVFPILLLIFILMIFYWSIIGLKKLKAQSLDQVIKGYKRDVKTTDEVNNQLVTSKLIGWYLFSAIIIGGLGGGGGYILADHTLGFAEQNAEMFGWVCAIILGVLSFNKRWELF